MTVPRQLIAHFFHDLVYLVLLSILHIPLPFRTSVQVCNLNIESGRGSEVSAWGLPVRTSAVAADLSLLGSEDRLPLPVTCSES